MSGSIKILTPTHMVVMASPANANANAYLASYAQNVRKRASEPITQSPLNSIDLSSILVEYSSAVPIAEVGEFFSALPESRRLLFLGLFSCVCSLSLAQSFYSA